MDKLIDTLRKSRLFSNITDSFIINNIIPLGTLRQFESDEIIISPQNIVNNMGILISGKVQISQLFSNGTNSLVNVLRPGMVLAADLFATKKRSSPYYAVSIELSDIFMLSKELFSVLRKTDEKCAWTISQNLLTLISHDNMKKHYRIAILSQNGLRARILTYLIMQANKLKKDSFQIPFSRIELADFLCVNRSALSHELSKMQQEGLIVFFKNRFHLTAKGKADCPWTGSANELLDLNHNKETADFIKAQ